MCQYHVMYMHYYHKQSFSDVSISCHVHALLSETSLSGYSQ